tara:strand:- start:123 stop:431 length:309 start_codon:yes stop_codon:yes gene_type:complete
MPRNIINILNNSNLTSNNASEVSRNMSDEQKTNINYQLVHTATERAIVEIYAQYPNSQVTQDLKARISQYLAELQSVIVDNPYNENTDTDTDTDIDTYNFGD